MPGDQPSRCRRTLAMQRAGSCQGATEKNKMGNGKTTYICASAPARKKKYVLPIFFLVRFWAFLGKGSSKTRGKKLSAFPKKNHRGNIFSGGIFFRVDFFDFCCCCLLRWLSASRQGEQKNAIKNVLSICGVVRLFFFPMRFFFIAFLGVSRQGELRNAIKKAMISCACLSQSQAE
jgi:hypothetical protein